MSAIDPIRARYPSPRQSSIDLCSQECYCVGGACFLYHGFDEDWSDNPRFPDVVDLAVVLETINPALDERQSWTLADRIITRNDEGDYDAAWWALETALTHAEEPTDG